jgi:hypothetical protein
MREALVDLRCPESEWAELRKGFGKEGRIYQQNRNFIKKIEVGDIALVPRPNQGVVYAGYVRRPFEILNDASWIDDYLALRLKQKLDNENIFSHFADVLHCCEVDSFITIPFAGIPAWIRRSFFGRSTYGIIEPRKDLNLDPVAELDHLMEVGPSTDWKLTRDHAEVMRRLVHIVGPTSFEHLCVALLQLEEPDAQWMHVGGSGDGGVDGMGYRAGEKAVELLQCKWAYNGEPVEIAGQARGRAIRQILASLLCRKDITPPEAVDFWGPEQIVRLILKHANQLPIATTLRVGKTND